MRNPSIRVTRPSSSSVHTAQPRPQCARASHRRFDSRADELDLGMDNLYSRIEVTAIERFVQAAQAADNLLILVRHRRDYLALEG